MENTKNLKLPLLVSNQSQKEITHNEALIIIDNILQNGIVDKDLVSPPANPNTNDLYIVGTNATGFWEGKDTQLAFYDNGWRFIEAKEGFTFWVNDEDSLYTYNGSIWKKTLEATGASVGSLDDLSDVAITSATQYDLLQHNGTNFVNTKQIHNLSLLGINTAADSTNKLSVKSDTILFDKATANSQIKVNKATATDTASHLFQTNYSGRAEFGLTGNDNFTLKVSSNGSTWNNSFIIDNLTGNVSFEKNIKLNGDNITPEYYSPIDTTIGLVQQTSYNGYLKIVQMGGRFCIRKCDDSSGTTSTGNAIFDTNLVNATESLVLWGPLLKAGTYFKIDANTTSSIIIQFMRSLN